MVTVIKDTRLWHIVYICHNEDCPYLYYPANYHGCRHPDRHIDDDYCIKEKCPIISTRYINKEVD